jgi:hypothetical protein
MADCLVYWKSYWTDIKETPDAVNEHWYNDNKRFYKQIKPGDSLWVVVSGGPEHPDEWRLLQRIYVIRKKPIASKYGGYDVIGDPKQGKHFRVASQPDFTSMLHKLEFISGKKIRAAGRLIGQALQTFRPLSDKDVVLLRAYANKLKAA